ncbi:MAG: 50S ribosomal protein L15 [Puniceicoccales bacterium]|jgi:large subunit ribosomal protein L15|nr:50S ribosomal protein L15 [Puniceicoccales bacterium]
MKLHTLIRGKNSGKARKRVGRGGGSGLGQTSGRGHKGGKARAGYTPSPIASGIPFYRRLPKRGFKHPRSALGEGYANLKDLARCGEVELIDRQVLVEKGILSTSARFVKILGEGDWDRPCKVVADRFSRAAKAKILAAGGEVQELSPKPEVKDIAPEGGVAEQKRSAARKRVSGSPKPEESLSEAASQEGTPKKKAPAEQALAPKAQEQPEE